MTNTIDEKRSLHYKALAHPRRARIFRLLFENSHTGFSFLTLQAATRLRPSSLAHHIREMERCGLVRRQRKGNRVSVSLTPLSLAEASYEVFALCEQHARPKRRAA